ncbi:helix-turn-helix transcriptional regulator [Agarilytica rhodophyticola]|uniref:helix-turn-helix transcriptional regulator n=1 Tax=Agarilytica rhodophyticola TaxID=1737490 RepID=UPI000B349EA9|nr:YafY family protein [Agarilytica rhodophyticola]
MRRADRLFQITQILRNRRSVTAKFLAERLEVSERTIYRDVQDLSLSGVPIEGEAGVGYMLRHSIDIPPIMFSKVEIQALALGARMVETWGGKELAQAALCAIDKIEGALPENIRHYTNHNHLYAFPYNFEEPIFTNIDPIRQAINDKCCIEFDYIRQDESHSRRKINPIALYFWGRVWTLTGWCHLRNDFRNFRIDRIDQLLTLDEHYVDQPGKTLDDYLKKVRQQDKYADIAKDYENGNL